MAVNKIVKRIVIALLIVWAVIFLLIFILIVGLVIRANHNEGVTKKLFDSEISKLPIPGCYEQSKKYTSGSIDQASVYSVKYVCDTINAKAYNSIVEMLEAQGFKNVNEPSIGSDGSILPPQYYSFSYINDTFDVSYQFIPTSEQIIIDGRYAVNPNARVSEIHLSIERAYKR